MVVVVLIINWFFGFVYKDEKYIILYYMYNIVYFLFLWIDLKNWFVIDVMIVEVSVNDKLFEG